MKVNAIAEEYRRSLKELYGEGELSQIIFLVFEHVKNFTKVDLVLKKDEIVSEEEQKQFDQILSELKSRKPIQYVLGFAWFYGMKFKVNEHVLIPRQETEELVEWIAESSKFKVQSSKLEILDVCTGSGCIAISLKKEFPEANVSAIDISEEALTVAKVNSRLNNAQIEIFRKDILQSTALNFKLRTLFDIIVSNPPYVTEKEKEKMDSKVIDFEPSLALFVSDDDALVFYNAIADFALENLKPSGKLYFEINEAKGKEVVELLTNKGFVNVELRRDLNGKDRMVKATLKF